MTDTEPADRVGRAPGRDPLDEAPATTPRGSLALTALAWCCAGVAAVGYASFLIGPLGMAFGLVAHLKGRRAGFVAAVACAVATVVGLSIEFLLFGGITG